MQDVEALDRLFSNPRDWDKAVVFMRHRGPIMLDESSEPKWVNSNSNLNCFEISSSDTADPTYDPQTDGQQPRICTHTITIGIEDIVAVDYIKYPKIITPSNGKLILS